MALLAPGACFAWRLVQPRARCHPATRIPFDHSAICPLPAGSPPPGALPLPPGFALPPPGWVGPDGMPLMPPPGCYWAMVPPPGMQVGWGWAGDGGWARDGRGPAAGALLLGQACFTRCRTAAQPASVRPCPLAPLCLTHCPSSPPGWPALLQFGNVDMAEVMAHGPWPYPFFPPGGPPPYPLPPPGAGLLAPPGVPLPPHQLPFGEEGVLAPFPPGMPVPLPPEAAQELAAAAAQAAAAAGAESAAAAADASGEPAAPQPAKPAAGAPEGAPRKGFLALLQQAYGPAGSEQPLAEASSTQRGPGFDAAAAAAELERRWQAVAPAAAPARSAAASPAPQPVGAAGQAPHSASKARPPSRGSSSGSLGSKAGKVATLGGGSSGRNSPAAGPGKPVVVAVRAWSSDDSASDGPKWKIQAAPQQQDAAGAAAGQRQQQQQ